MNPFASTKSDDKKISSRNLLGGGLGFFDEIGFEVETPTVSAIGAGVSGVIKDLFSLGNDVVGSKTESASQEQQKFPPSGSIEFNKAQSKAAEDVKKKEDAAENRVFFQALKDDQQRAEQTKNKMLFEEEMGDIITNLPTDEKNKLLHYQSSYKDRSIYQRAELRRKIIEQRKQSDKQQKQASMQQANPKASAMNAALEGGSGTQGGGQANLSFQATG